MGTILFDRARRKRVVFPGTLWRCCALRDGGGVERELARGAPANATLEGPSLAIVADLLRHKASAEELSGLSPLALCARVGATRCFEALLASERPLQIDKRLRAKSAAGVGMMRLAIASRSVPMADRAMALAREGRLPLESGALSDAIAWGRRSLVEALWDMGADVNESVGGVSPMIQAARRAMPWAMRSLAERGASIESRRGSDGATALMIAADQGHLPMMELALSLGADVDAKDYASRPAIQRLALKRDARASRWLLAHGADPESVCPKERLTALGRAARGGNVPGMRALLEAGADPTSVGHGRRPWMDERESRGVVGVLGAWMMNDLAEEDDSACNDGLGALEWAIKSGVDIDEVDAKGNWALKDALARDDHKKRAARMLLEAGASTEIKTPSGETLLESYVLNHLTPRKRVCKESVELLLAFGAAVTEPLREILRDQSWVSGYSYDLEWLGRLKAAALRQDELRELDVAVSEAKPVGPKRM